MLFSINTISKEGNNKNLNYVIYAKDKENAKEIFLKRYMNQLDKIEIIDILPIESDFIRVYEIEEVTPHSFYVKKYTDVEFDCKPLNNFNSYVIKAFGKEMGEKNVSSKLINSKVTLVVATEYSYPLFMTIFNDTNKF